MNSAAPTRRAGACTLGVIAFLAVSASAGPQRDAPSGRPTFEAATVKLAAPDAMRNRVLPSGPTRMRIPGMTLSAQLPAAN